MKRLLLLLSGLVLVAGCGDPVYPAAQVQPVVAGPPAVVTVAVPVKVQIPALHVTDDLVPVGLAALERGELLPVDSVGWYDPAPSGIAPRPGQLGRAVLAGHINYEGEAGAFAHLPSLKVGDLVTTTAADGVTTTFTVYLTKQVKKADYTAKTVPLVFGRSSGRELALITCSGTVVGHSYLDNTVVLARAI